MNEIENIMGRLKERLRCSEHTCKTKVLIVEDNTHDAVILESTLSRIGCDVTVCVDGFCAIKAVEESNDFQVAFLDLNLPGMDGVEVFHGIRKINPEIFIVIVTGTNRIKELPAEGYYGVVMKPLKEKDAKKIISQAR